MLKIAWQKPVVVVGFSIAQGYPPKTSEVILPPKSSVTGKHSANHALQRSFSAASPHMARALLNTATTGRPPAH